MVEIMFADGVNPTDIIYDTGSIISMSERIIEILQTHKIPFIEISNPVLKDISEDYKKIIELCNTTRKKAEWIRNTCIEPEEIPDQKKDDLLERLNKLEKDVKEDIVLVTAIVNFQEKLKECKSEINACLEGNENIN